MQIFLIIIGILLILFNVRFIRDENRSVFPKRFTKKENSNFTNILEKEEINISEVDVRIGELRSEFSETLIELQKEIMELNEKIEDLAEGKPSAAAIDTIDIEEISGEAIYTDNIELEPEDIKLEKVTYTKADQVGLLMDKGYTIDEICEKLQIGRGEVLLIKKLYQK
jgi:predicted nuclease with TOPRIM domain